MQFLIKRLCPSQWKINQKPRQRPFHKFSVPGDPKTVQQVLTVFKSIWKIKTFLFRLACGEGRSGLTTMGRGGPCGRGWRSLGQILICRPCSSIVKLCIYIKLVCAAVHLFNALHFIASPLLLLFMAFLCSGRNYMYAYVRMFVRVKKPESPPTTKSI